MHHPCSLVVKSQTFEEAGIKVANGKKSIFLTTASREFFGAVAFSHLQRGATLLE
jgi:hypothetical protein